VPRFRLGRSPGYLRISPLHPEFQTPLPASSPTVYAAVPRLSRGLSPRTCEAAYMRFKPSDSEQRLPPLYYRGCWHRVSRGFFWDRSSRVLLKRADFFTLKGVYNPRAFFLHAASLRQAFAHCGIFVTAATRRCPGSVSVPMWPANLSVRLPVEALVSRYLTNWLIGYGPLSVRQARRSLPFDPPGMPPADVIRYYRHFRKGNRSSRRYPCARGTLPIHYSPVRHYTSYCYNVSFDLHVLATPPAFVLSQDQTLRLKSGPHTRRTRKARPCGNVHCVVRRAVRWPVGIDWPERLVRTPQTFRCSRTEGFTHSQRSSFTCQRAWWPMGNHRPPPDCEPDRLAQASNVI
jgi:hypothetical protein